MRVDEVVVTVASLPLPLCSRIARNGSVFALSTSICGATGLYTFAVLLAASELSAAVDGVVDLSCVCIE